MPALELTPDRPTSFFATPENAALLQRIRLKYPDGRTGLVRRHTRPAEPLFEYYVVDQAAPGGPAPSLARSSSDRLPGRAVTAEPVRQPSGAAAP